MTSLAITGTSRGIGLELVRQLLDFPKDQVSKIFAITRSHLDEPLQRLIDGSHGRIENIVIEDFCSALQVQKAANQIQESLHGRGLDILVNNAGIMPASAGKIESVTGDQMLGVFGTNVVGAHVITSNFLPLLRAGAKKLVVNVSTAMGSIAYAPRYTFAPAHAYKISKAAMNMLNAQYALQYAEEGFTFVAISPGWIKTDLGSQYADLEVATGVTSVRDIILKADTSMNGKFVNIRVSGWEEAEGANQYNGAEIPW
ncbi:hypothetical protein LTR35_017722 [Friedmanniomyces endolithicus]|uniref:Short chain oxidoreductase n=1 Tax=Friedmanniomyces endolithicus TaxID=329885 RepID=A0AAN6F7P1_9PEZI|nr:hypothetical protein LTR35_017722 [Friedmanniomyces endolithicus]KAK0268432.1 hypothetical protein LTS00_017570 [Friedmanniomyces endolithicus]KAK0303338.1 hypothetical protein LTR82_017581 [Friedmanniomyces endolithicus]KAK0969551.1 hypothetical protein LTR54_018082 [Friedmanniomyces endolithicus]